MGLGHDAPCSPSMGLCRLLATRNLRRTLQIANALTVHTEPGMKPTASAAPSPIEREVVAEVAVAALVERAGERDARLHGGDGALEHQLRDGMARSCSRWRAVFFLP